MKIKALILTVFVAGFAASFAVAKPPPGKGKHAGGEAGDATASSTGTTTTTTTAALGKKVLVCHKVGHGGYVLISVSRKSAPARLKHKGDVLAVNGACPTAAATTGTTGTTTNTTVTTTPGTTTTTP